MASNCFKGRAETVLKLTSELSTLCDTPACVVIYNPRDVIKPWLIWPDDETRFRRVIQLYKNLPKQTHTHSRSRKPRAKPIASSSSPSTSCSDGSLSAAQVKVLGTTRIENVNLEAIGDGRISKKHFDCIMSDGADYHPATRGEKNPVLAGKEPSLAIDGGIDSIAVDTTGSVCGGCEWDENEMFEVDELMNSSDHQEDTDVYATNCSSFLNGTDSTSLLMMRANGNYDPMVRAADAAVVCDELYEETQPATDHLATTSAVLTAMPPAASAFGNYIEDAENYATVCIADEFPTYFDEKLWNDGETEAVDLDDFFNFSGQEQAAAGHGHIGETTTTTCSVVSMSMPAQPAAVLGNKRKAAEQVFSFSELMAPSSQRQRIC